MDFKEFYREFEDEVKDDLSAALWDKARVKADPEGFAKELFDSDIGFTAEEAAEEFVDMIYVMKEQGELNEARPRPFRPSPQDRAGIYEPVDPTARAKDKYAQLGSDAERYRNHPVQYTAGLIGDLLSTKLNDHKCAGFPVWPHWYTEYMGGNNIKSYHTDVELPVVTNIYKALENLAKKEGLFVGDGESHHAAICLGVGDGPKNIRDAHATARKYVDSVCKVLTSLRKIADREGSRNFGVTYEALDDSIIDEIASAAAGLPKGDWRSYEKENKTGQAESELAVSFYYSPSERICGLVYLGVKERM